jgi:hypothetical protein
VVDLQTVSVVLTGISVSLAAVYYAMTLRRQQETRNAQVFIQLYQKAMDQGYLRSLTEAVWLQKDEGFDEWWEKHGPESDIEFFVRWWSGLVFYESVGILVKKRMIDPAIVDDLISGPILLTWEKYEPIIMGIREKEGWPQFQEYQEYLTGVIRKIVDKQHPDFRK